MIDRLREHRLTRRELLGGIVAAGTVFAADQTIHFSEQKPEIKPQEKTKENTMDELLQQILDIPPFTDKRDSFENIYLSRVEINPTLKGIDQGFWVFADSSNRAKLLNLRWALREKGEGLRPLPQEKIDWAKSQNIKPEVLAIAIDAYEKARIIAKDLIDAQKLRDDETKVTPDEVLINPGGMAQLIDYETGDVHHYSRYSFTNIGDGVSIEQFKGDSVYIDRMTKSLTDLCREISKNTGLKFDAARIPGSKPVNPNDGGGAISIQFMPDNALSIYDMVLDYTKDKTKLNVFDVTDATVMAYIFLARHESYYPRYGYRRGVIKDQINALRKWNDDTNEVNTILEVAIDYFKKFIDGQPAGTY